MFKIILYDNWKTRHSGWLAQRNPTQGDIFHFDNELIGSIHELHFDFPILTGLEVYFLKFNVLKILKCSNNSSFEELNDIVIVAYNALSLVSELMQPLAINGSGKPA